MQKRTAQALSAPTLPLVHATKCTFFPGEHDESAVRDLVQRNRVMGSWPETPVTLTVRANLVATFDQKRRGISSLPRNADLDILYRR